MEWACFRIVVCRWLVDCVAIGFMRLLAVSFEFRFVCFDVGCVCWVDDLLL